MHKQTAEFAVTHKDGRITKTGTAGKFKTKNKISGGARQKDEGKTKKKKGRTRQGGEWFP